MCCQMSKGSRHRVCLSCLQDRLRLFKRANYVQARADHEAPWRRFRHRVRNSPDPAFDTTRPPPTALHQQGQSQRRSRACIAARSIRFGIGSSGISSHQYRSQNPPDTGPQASSPWLMFDHVLPRWFRSMDATAAASLRPRASSMASCSSIAVCQLSFDRLDW